MTKIRFISTPKIPHDMADEWEDYVKDSVHEMNDIEADRWLRRGVAEVVQEVRVVEISKEKVIQSIAPKVMTSSSSTTLGNLSSSSSGMVISASENLKSSLEVSSGGKVV